jgi:hypothetical protein
LIEDVEQIRLFVLIGENGEREGGEDRTAKLAPIEAERPHRGGEAEKRRGSGGWQRMAD